MLRAATLPHMPVTRPARTPLDLLDRSGAQSTSLASRPPTDLTAKDGPLRRQRHRDGGDGATALAPPPRMAAPPTPASGSRANPIRIVPLSLRYAVLTPQISSCRLCLSRRVCAAGGHGCVRASRRRVLCRPGALYRQHPRRQYPPRHVLLLGSHIYLSIDGIIATFFFSFAPLWSLFGC